MTIKNFLPQKIIFFIKYLLANSKRVVNYMFVSKNKQHNIYTLADGKNPTFFGYHDKTPFSLDGTKLLAMSISSDDAKAESEGNFMKVGYFRKALSGEFENKFVPVDHTYTWCYQQGCMLQWNPINPNEEIIFNTLINGVYGAIVFNVITRQRIKEFIYPIYSIDPKGKFAATLNFSRLGRLRPGYGYGLFEDNSIIETASGNDGLFIFDLHSMKKQLLVSLAELAHDVSDKNCQHYINHATFSPNGSRLIFFHLWTKADINQRFHRVCEVEVLTGKWRIIESSRILSHYCWKNEQSILGTTIDSQGKWKYTLYDLVANSRKDLFQSPYNDGHPMYHPFNDDVFVTDTYPDRWNEQKLLVYNTNSNKHKLVGKFFSPFKYSGQVRCDLHPRWDREGDYLAIDSTHDGRRQMKIIKL